MTREDQPQPLETPPHMPRNGFAMPKRRDTGAQLRAAGGYSRRVGMLRWALPVLAVLILGTLILWPVVQNHKVTTAIVETVPDLVIENLNYSGVDGDNQPYSVQAAKATQVPNTKTLIDLDQPRADITLASGDWLAGRADQGRFDQRANRLWLGGGVEFFHDQGYQVKTEEAQFDMKNNLAWGAKPVSIHGSFGEIQGSGFRILDKGKVIVVTGQSRAVLNLRKPEPSAKPEATAVEP